jgi:hypothetical protein
VLPDPCTSIFTEFLIKYPKRLPCGEVSGIAYVAGDKSEAARAAPTDKEDKYRTKHKADGGFFVHQRAGIHNTYAPPTSFSFLSFLFSPPRVSVDEFSLPSSFRLKDGTNSLCHLEQMPISEAGRYKRYANGHASGALESWDIHDRSVKSLDEWKC